MRTRLRPEDDEARVVLSPNVCPPIVTKELFDQVQRQLALNQEQATRNSHDPEAYLLRGGFAVCGYCGSKMTTSTSGPVGKKIRMYRCRQATSLAINRCPGRNYVITTTVLDKAIWSAVEYLFSDPERIRLILATQPHHQEQEEKADHSHKQAVEGQLELVQRQIANATRQSSMLRMNQHMCFGQNKSLDCCRNVMISKKS